MRKYLLQYSNLKRSSHKRKNQPPVLRQAAARLGNSPHDLDSQTVVHTSPPWNSNIHTPLTAYMYVRDNSPAF